MKHEGWAELGRSLGCVLDHEQVERLARYELLVRRRGVPLGMVARGDAGRLRERHIADCLRATAAVRAGDRFAYDLGSGAGLPGIPIAIAHPRLTVVLVESRRTRAAFLQMAVEELALTNARVFADRADRLKEPADLCLSRAFTNARDAWFVAEPLLLPRGRLVYFAGRSPLPQLPAGVRTEILSASSLARSGPLVIMTRQ